MQDLASLPVRRASGKKGYSPGKVVQEVHENVDQ